MPQFDSSTFGTYAGKSVLATAAFEVALATQFLVLGLANPEVRFGMVITVAGVSSGVSGTATITSLTQTGMFLNENPQVEMGLDGPTPGPPSVPGHAEGVRAADPPGAAEWWHRLAGQGRPRQPERRGHRLGRAFDAAMFEWDKI